MNKEARDIGIDVKLPKKGCDDKNCPFHGKISVRGQILEGTVVNNKMQGTIVIEKQRLRYVPKYERYEKRTSRYSAHNPPCLDANVGNLVKIMECRPISKTVSFVVVEVVK